MTNITTGTETEVLLNDGDDLIHVGGNATPAANVDGTLNRVQAALTIDGGAGFDRLVADDTAETQDNVGLLQESLLTGLDMHSDGIAYGQLELIDINLGEGDDTLTIESTHRGATNLRLGAGADPVNVQSIAGHTAIYSGDGDDTIRVGSLAPSLGGLVDAIAALLTISGDSGADTMYVDDRAETADNDGLLTESTLLGLDMHAASDVDLVQTVSVNADGGQFELEVQGLPGGPRITSPIDYDAAAETVAAALRAVFGTNHDVAVSKIDNVYTVRYQAQLAGLAGQALGMLVADSSGLLPVAGAAAARVDVAIRTEGINYYGLETLDVGLGGGDDRFSVQGASAETFLDAAAGDDLVYVSSGALASALDQFAPADGGLAELHGLILHATRRDPVSGAPTAAGGTLDYILGALHLEAGAGHNTLSVSDQNDADADDNVVITNNSLHGLAPADITYQATGGDFSGKGKWTRMVDAGLFGRGINLYGGFGGNNVDVQSVHSSGPLATQYEKTVTTLLTGDGPDTVRVSVANDPFVILTIHGQDGGDASTRPARLCRCRSLAAPVMTLSREARVRTDCTASWETMSWPADSAMTRSTGMTVTINCSATRATTNFMAARATISFSGVMEMTWSSPGTAQRKRCWEVPGMIASPVPMKGRRPTRTLATIYASAI